MEFQSMKHLPLVPPENFPKTADGLKYEDGLEILLKEQYLLNRKIYPLALKNLHLDEHLLIDGLGHVKFTDEQKEAMTKEYLLAIIRECCEALDMINSKFWKQTRKDVDVTELKYEFIDIQHFVNSLYDIWQMDRNEVLGIFLAKVKENHERNKKKY